MADLLCSVLTLGDLPVGSCVAFQKALQRVGRQLRTGLLSVAQLISMPELQESQSWPAKQPSDLGLDVCILYTLNRRA